MHACNTKRNRQVTAGAPCSLDVDARCCCCVLLTARPAHLPRLAALLRCMLLSVVARRSQNSISIVNSLPPRSPQSSPGRVSAAPRSPPLPSAALSGLLSQLWLPIRTR